MRDPVVWYNRWTRGDVVKLPFCILLSSGLTCHEPFPSTPDALPLALLNLAMHASGMSMAVHPI